MIISFYSGTPVCAMLSFSGRRTSHSVTSFILMEQFVTVSLIGLYQNPAATKCVLCFGFLESLVAKESMSAINSMKTIHFIENLIMVYCHDLI